MSIPTSVSKGRDVPGQTGTGRPVVPLSRDKKILPVPLSLCPGTRAGANVPGQTPLSRDVPGQNEFQNFQKKDQIFCFRTSFSCFRTSFSALSHFVPCPVPARPVPWQDFELVLLSICPGTMKELLSRCPEKLHYHVPLETLFCIGLQSKHVLVHRVNTSSTKWKMFKYR